MIPHRKCNFRELQHDLRKLGEKPWRISRKPAEPMDCRALPGRAYKSTSPHENDTTDLNANDDIHSLLRVRRLCFISSLFFSFIVRSRSFLCEASTTRLAGRKSMFSRTHASRNTLRFSSAYAMRSSVVTVPGTPTSKSGWRA